VAQALAGVRQLVFLAGAKIGGFYLRYFVAKQIALTSSSSDLVLKFSPLGLNGSPATYQLADRAAQLDQPSEAIEKIEMFTHAQQREMLTLTVDVDQVLSHLLEQRDRYRSPVQPCDASSAARQLAA
jgi:hypothetical protein